MLGMNLSADMDTGINTESGEGMPSGIHGLDMEMERLLVARSVTG